MKVAVIIMGFGDPYWDKKVDILKNNIKILEKWEPDYYVSQYTLDKDIDIPNLNVIKNKGILGQLLYDNWHPDKFINYDHIIILLDDIELQDNFDLDYIVNIKNKYNFDILSPSLTNDSKFSHSFMLHENKNYIIKETNFCELFCYVMNFETYKKFYGFIDRENPWIWGMDTILRTVMGFNIGILNNVNIKHYFKGSGSMKARTDMHEYLKKYNVPFKIDCTVLKFYNE